MSVQGNTTHFFWRRPSRRTRGMTLTKPRMSFSSSGSCVSQISGHGSPLRLKRLGRRGGSWQSNFGGGAPTPGSGAWPTISLNVFCVMLALLMFQWGKKHWGDFRFNFFFVSRFYSLVGPNIKHTQAINIQRATKPKMIPAF